MIDKTGYSQAIKNDEAWERREIEYLLGKMLNEFGEGDRVLDEENGELRIDMESLVWAAKEDLIYAKDKWGEDAAQEIKKIHPDWLFDRIKNIINQKTPPRAEEIVQHSEFILDLDDEFRFMIFVGVFPLSSNTLSRWAVIREAGIALDREYEVVGVFSSLAGAEAFIGKSYPYSVAEMKIE